jgi:hypothetical protein
LVNDLSGSRVLYVDEDREQKSLDGFWPTLTDNQRQGIKAVAMDMWRIVFDKYHIAKHLGEAVDRPAEPGRRASKRSLHFTCYGG